MWCKNIVLSLFYDHVAKDNVNDEVNEVDNVVNVDFHRLERNKES